MREINLYDFHNKSSYAEWSLCNFSIVTGEHYEDDTNSVWRVTKEVISVMQYLMTGTYGKDLVGYDKSKFLGWPIVESDSNSFGENGLCIVRF